MAWARGSARPLALHLVVQQARRRFGVDDPDLDLVRRCRSCGSSRHGRPVLVPRGYRAPETAGLPHVSLSRTADLTVVALTDAGPVGVDVERSDAASFPGFDLVCLHPEERPADDRERTITWVRKEALLKAVGRGLVVEPSTLRLTEAAEAPALLAWTAPGPPDTPVWLEDLALPDDHVGAVAVLAERRPELVLTPAAEAGAPPGTASW